MYTEIIPQTSKFPKKDAKSLKTKTVQEFCWARFIRTLPDLLSTLKMYDSYSHILL